MSLMRLKEQTLIVGDQPFQVAIGEGATLSIGQYYVDEEGNKRTRAIMFTFDGLWACYGGVANRLRKMGFEVLHPIEFNKIFRRWLKENYDHGEQIIKVYEQVTRERGEMKKLFKELEKKRGNNFRSEYDKLRDHYSSRFC